MSNQDELNRQVATLLQARRMPGMPAITTVAIVGTGVIGRSWIQVFARAGCRTRIYDPERAQVEKALKWLEEEAEPGRDLVTAHRDLREALAGAGYVQESGPERIDVKKAIFAELDRVADPVAILASSSSALDMTEIAAGLPGARRAIVAHPVNPPHVIPVVEIVPGKETDPEVVKRTCAFLAGLGQKPVLLNFYIPGFLLNRMQVALVREALHLVQSGVAGVDAVDTVIREGLGLRWALLGPFGVADTGADGGIREYFMRFGDSFTDLVNRLGPTPFINEDLVQKLGQGTDAMMGTAPRAEIRRWRDRLIRRICRLKEEDPKP